MAVLRLQMPGVELNAVTPFHPPIGGQPPSAQHGPLRHLIHGPLASFIGAGPADLPRARTGHVLNVWGSPVLGVCWIGAWRLGNWCRVRRLRRRSRRRGNGWIGSWGQTSGTPRLAGPGSGSISCSSIRFANIAWSAPSSRQRLSAITSSHITATSNKFWLGPFQSLCKPCHDSTKQFVELRGYRPDIGLNGLPLDPRHPCYRTR